MRYTISWGNGLLFVFLVFSGMISYMVYRCMQTPVDLVAKEYYQEELRYQQIIDARKKAEALSRRIEIRQTAEAIVLTMPGEMRNKELTGFIQFYCPSDANKDQRFDLEGSLTNEQNEQVIAAHLLKPGHYNVKVQWQTGGETYFTEQPFIVN